MRVRSYIKLCGCSDRSFFFFVFVKYTRELKNSFRFVCNQLCNYSELRVFRGASSSGSDSHLTN